MCKKYYSGIGSRETPIEIQNTMSTIASKLEDRGYILRSGGASGADEAFESGVKDHSNMQIFLPFEGFNNKNAGVGYLSKYSEKDVDNANNSVIHFHPLGHSLKGKIHTIMGRNFFQVCGLEGENFSDFVLCWTPDGATKKTTRGTGGTGQAIRIANYLDIPVYNLKNITSNIDYFLDSITKK